MTDFSLQSVALLLPLPLRLERSQGSQGLEHVVVPRLGDDSQAFQPVLALLCVQSPSLLMVCPRFGSSLVLALCVYLVVR